MITRMDAIRQDPEGGCDIGLRQFMQETYTENGQPLGPEHLYAELGIDPHRTRVKDLMADEDNKWLMAEIVRDGVRQGMGIAARERAVSQGPVISDGGTQRFMQPDIYLEPQRLGLVQSTFFPDLIVREEPVASPTVTIPNVSLSAATLKDTGEAATIEEGSVTYGSKQVTLTKKARGIKITYEAIQFNSLSLVQIFFQDAGRILGHTLNTMAINTLVSGDVSGGTEAAGVVGVEATANKITWYDLTRAAIQGGLIGRVFSQIIGNAQTALDFLNLAEVKNKTFPGGPLLGTVMRSPLTMPEALYVSPVVPTGQVILQDPSMSLVQLTAIPLMVETEKIISKQLEASFASIMTGFAKLMRNSSFILDGTILYSGNGYPAWMQPFSVEP
jgi:hypothetical protein